MKQWVICVIVMAELLFYLGVCFLLQPEILRVDQIDHIIFRQDNVDEGNTDEDDI